MSPSSVGADTSSGLGRERRLADTFVLLADTLVDDYDVVDLLNQLAAACVSLFDITAAGLLLDDQAGQLAVVGSSSEETRLLEAIQIQSNQGPCLECVHTRTAVTSADLAADSARWPLFVPVALTAGFRAVTAVPLRLRDQSIGALSLFDERAAPITEHDQRVAQALADVAAIGILQRRSVHQRELVTEQLQHAVNSRVVIEQAKGVLAERNATTVQAAFLALRQHSRNYNHKLTEVALAVVRGEIDPATVTANT
jgi:GAF domain-containing protein